MPVALLGQGSNTFRVVSSASYATTVAPNSLASIFGTNLALAKATATLDSNGNLPVELASTRVEVNGTASSLLYVSPAQINFVMPSGMTTGAATVVVRSTTSGVTQTATVTVASTAPGLFSSDASGTGPGAILNAVTYQPAPFLVETAANGGSDLRTRLAVYGTGFRQTTAPSATAVDPSGNTYNLTVEYAGAAPGFFGLDQANVVLPADLDAAGTVSLTFGTEDGVSNTVTFQVGLLPASSIRLVSLALSPSTVSGGGSMTGTVGLNGTARAGGFAVSLRSSNPAAQPPSQVVVAQGKASGQTAIGTVSVNTVQTGTITATAQGATQTASFEVDPANQAKVAALTLSTTSLPGGQSLTGTVSLAAPAASGGVSVQIASDDPSVKVPATVSVPFNQSSATFNITTMSVTTAGTANLTATLGSSSATAQLQVLPLLALSIDAAAVTDGNLVNGTVTLAQPAQAPGAIVLIGASDVSAVRPPATVTVLTGQTTTTFVITTLQVTSARTVTITASYMGVMQSVNLTVNPPGVAALFGLTLSPSQVTGGQTAQGTVTLTAPAGNGGLIVNLRSSSAVVAQVPGFVIVPVGQTSATLTIQTNAVPATQAVTITATAGSATQSAVLTVH
jgi:uncharacterized protein (TIGR03437 family)